MIEHITCTWYLL